jgi:1-phosphofructokinase/tagatose 6-phosphate kinase
MTTPDSTAFLAVCANPTLQKTLRFDSVDCGEVNRVRQHRLDVAGKGLIVTRVLSQLGRKAVHLTHLGGELRGIFLDLCGQDRLDVRWVEGGCPIRFCYTVISGSGGERGVTELVEEGGPVAEGTGERLMAKYRELLPACSTVILSGSKAKGYGGDIIPGMTRLARESGKRVILDLRGSDLVNSLPFEPDLIKPNLREFTETFLPELAAPDMLSGAESKVRESVAETALKLCAEYRTNIVLSRGGQSVWYCGGGSFGEYPAEPVEAVNTTGSGDALTAGIACALEDGASLTEAVARGVRCGSLNAGLLKPGVIR